jgi:hypothetical protein
VLVYYRGRNDAWDGYGGGFLYTRAAECPEAIKPRVAAALEKGTRIHGSACGDVLSILVY